MPRGTCRAELLGRDPRPDRRDMDRQEALLQRRRHQRISAQADAQGQGCRAGSTGAWPPPQGRRARDAHRSSSERATSARGPQQLEMSPKLAPKPARPIERLVEVATLAAIHMESETIAEALATLDTEARGRRILRIS